MSSDLVERPGTSVACPQLLGAIVRDANGCHWVRYGHDSWSEPWLMLATGQSADWADIVAVSVVFDGVPDAG